MRWVWGHGRVQLGASLAVDITLNARELTLFVGIDDQSLLPIMSVNFG
jgi:hypothetical protein